MAFAAINHGWLPAIQFAGARGKLRTQRVLIQALVEDVGWMGTANLALQAKQEGDEKTSELLFAGLREKHTRMAQVKGRIPHDLNKCPHSVDEFDVRAARAAISRAQSNPAFV